jgi:hypothetical protein
MVLYKGTDQYEATSASVRVTEDGESGVIVFVTTGQKNVFVKAKRNVLSLLQRRLTRSLDDQAPHSAPPKAGGKRGGVKKT